MKLDFRFMAGWLQRLKALQPRERLAVFCLVVALTLVVWNNAVLMRMATRYSNANAQLTHLNADSDSNFGAVAGVAEVTALTARAEQLQRDEAAIRQLLIHRAAAFVDPSEMVNLVRDLLHARAGLKLVRLATEEPQQLNAAEIAANPDEIVDGDVAAVPAVAYVHEMELVVEGSFQDVHQYLRALESQRWNFLWRGLDIEVAEYPKLKARLKLATVSVDRHWSGV